MAAAICGRVEEPVAEKVDTSEDDPEAVLMVEPVVNGEDEQ